MPTFWMNRFLMDGDPAGTGGGGTDPAPSLTDPAPLAETKPWIDSLPDDLKDDSSLKNF